MGFCSLQRSLDEGLLIDRLGLGEAAFLLLGGGLLLAYCLKRFGHLSLLGVADEDRSLGSWGGREVLELVGSAMALLLFLGWMFADTLEAAGLGALLLNMAWMCISVGIALGLVWQADGAEGLRALGLRPSPLQVTGQAPLGTLRAVLLGLLSYALLSPFLLGVYLSWPAIASGIGIVVEDQGVLMDVLNLEGAQLAAAVLFAGALGPLLEELLFRGFLQPVLVRAVGGLAGIVCTSWLFAMMHEAVVFLPIFVFSLLLGWVQLRTRSLFASWAVHAAHNSFILFLYL